MNKLKWTYDKETKVFTTGEFDIKEIGTTYELIDHINYQVIEGLKKLESAKQVAHLLRFG